MEGIDADSVPFEDRKKDNLVAEVSTKVDQVERNVGLYHVFMRL